MNFMADWPFPLAVTALFVIVMLRANGTYWLGRGARAGADRTRAKKILASKGYQRAERLVNRFGAPAVTVCFLTVGVQTMINIAAGATRMPLRRYLPAVTLGSIIWAFVYATVGFVTVEALVQLWQLSPVLCLLVATALLALLVVFIVRAVRHREDDAELAESDEGAAVDAPSAGDSHAASRRQ